MSKQTRITTVPEVITRPMLCQILGIGSEAIRRQMKSGKIPKPAVQLSLRTIAWRKDQLQNAGVL